MIPLIQQLEAAGHHARALHAEAAAIRERRYRRADASTRATVIRCLTEAAGEPLNTSEIQARCPDRTAKQIAYILSILGAEGIVRRTGIRNKYRYFIPCPKEAV